MKAMKMMTRLALCAGAMLAGSVAEAAFVPTDLTGLASWLRADVGVSTSGANVTGWADGSGNGNNATTGISPVVVANGLNGRQSVNFGNNPVAHLNLPTASTLGTLNSDYEIFVVARTPSTAIQFLTGGGFAFGAEDYEMHLNGASGLRGIPNAGNYRDVGTNGQFVSLTPHVFSLRVDGNVGTASADGVDSTSQGPARSTTDTLLTLGVRGDASFGFAGDMGEVIVYNRALSASERTQVQNYLTAAWMPLRQLEVGPTGNPAPDNVARSSNGAVAFAKDLIANGAFAPSHTIANVNDGIYGNSNSWIGNSANSFVGVAFDGSQYIDQVAWGRDSDGVISFFDRADGLYTVQYTTVANPNALTSDSDWITIGSVLYTSAFGNDRFLRHLYEFDAVHATGLRIITSTNGIAIDELEVFAAYVPEPATMSLLALGALAMGRRRRRNEVCQG